MGKKKKKHSIKVGFRFSTSLPTNQQEKTKMDQEKQQENLSEKEQQNLYSNEENKEDAEKIQSPLRILAIDEISDSYKKWANEYMTEHAKLMEEFENLCNVDKSNNKSNQLFTNQNLIGNCRVGNGRGFNG